MTRRAAEALPGRGSSSPFRELLEPAVGIAKGAAADAVEDCERLYGG